MKRAAAQGEAAETYRALLGWVDRCGLGGIETGTLDALVAFAEDEKLACEVACLSAALYGKDVAERWVAEGLVEALQRARCSMPGTQAARNRSVFGPLNP